MGAQRESNLPEGAVRTGDGSFTLTGAGHGQAAHSTFGARTEARERYARLCIDGPFDAPIARGSGGAPWRLLDIGLGLGLNTTAAWERLLACRGAGARLAVVALENDRGIVERALALPPDPDPGFAALHARTSAALRAALDCGAERWSGEVAPGFELEVRFGDARATLLAAPECGPFDAVFLDPFSPGVDGALWELDFLAAVARRMAEPAVLSTYSAATRVRGALAAAGLTVGVGPRLGPKAEGTLATRGLAVPSFDPRTAARVARRAKELADEHGSRPDPL